MAWIDGERAALARSVDLLSYLKASEPYELKKNGASEYRTASHGSLVISKGFWYWNRGGFGGRSALDYLIKVRGMGFAEAVEAVLGRPAAPVSFLPAEEKKLFLPKPVSVPARAVKYLRRRGIRPEIIAKCLKSGIFYESVYRNPKESEYDGAAVCVFLGCDKDGRERFAALRGINTDLKKDAAGSDKRFGFKIAAAAANCGELKVFESPIDLLSEMSLSAEEVVRDCHRLSLGGISPNALLFFLAETPCINEVTLCLDNDDAGLSAMKRISALLAASERFSRRKISCAPPKRGKDYNEALLLSIQQEKERAYPARRKEIGVSLD
ncbi:MAG: DUF3991 and toprim domain-containing protein [Gracilibacteraceae bacterium]|jgi:hypothetical protein|nr:DUF3991 and toprim domain-containing protein [Gracilibacteraceae bacterium]